MFTKTTMATIALVAMMAVGTAVHARNDGQENGAGCINNCGQGGGGGEGGVGGQGGAGGNAYAGAVGVGLGGQGGAGGNANQGQMQGQALFNQNDLSNRNDNRNTNTNFNTAKGGDANQGQLQGQGQGQMQGQAQSADQANAQENTMIVEDSGQMHYSGSYDVKTVGVAVAPDIQATAGCRKPLSAGAGWMGGAFSFGTTFLDETCVQFENIRFGLTSTDPQTRALADEVLQMRLAADLDEALEEQAKKEGKDVKSTSVVYGSTTETADNDDGWSNYQNLIGG